jgi:uncharacterized repeat protein (TIGR03917 family)
MGTAKTPPGAEQRAGYDCDGAAEDGVPDGASDCGSWTVTVAPGADPATFAAELSQLPAQVRFVEAYGDVEVVLLFARLAGPADG